MPIYWEYYEHVITEKYDQGILQIPVAAPDGVSAEIVKQHAATGKRVVRWVVASRGGSPADLPEMPSALAFAADAVLESREMNGHSPIPCKRGVWLYICWGEYVYAIVKARAVDGDFPIGGLPPSFASLGDAASFFPAAKFKRYLDGGSFARGLS